MAKRKPLRSDIAHSSPDRIVIKGMDLCRDMLGHMTLGDMAFLELTDRRPTAAEARMFNALAVTLVEHGLTPSALVARLTIVGAPDAMQAAVGAGLCGLGSTYVGSMEDSARMLQSTLPFGVTEIDIPDAAERIVDDFSARKRFVPGLGHALHKPVDPRTGRLFEIAAETGFSGRYVALMQAVAESARRRSKIDLPINATGAIAAIASEMKLSWKIVRGIGVMARAIGLVGHIREELANPIAIEMKLRTEEEAMAHFKDN